MVFNGKRNVLTKRQMETFQIGVTVFDDNNMNPILYKRQE